MVSIKHIHTVKSVPKTYCFSNTKPDALRRLTGQQERPLEIFVEDSLARSIVENELSKLGMQRISNVTLYGAAINCFTLAAGLILSGGHCLESQLFLLDGDVFITTEQQQKQAEAVLTGTEPNADKRRETLLKGVRKLCVKDHKNLAPEAQLHWMICNLPRQQDEAANEIIELASSIQAVDDTHSFISLIVQTLNVDSAVGLSNIVKVAALSHVWETYVLELHEWLLFRRPIFIEDNLSINQGIY